MCHQFRLVAVIRTWTAAGKGGYLLNTSNTVRVRDFCDRPYSQGKKGLARRSSTGGLRKKVVRRRYFRVNVTCRDDE
jgi:hypothetical protein